MKVDFELIVAALGLQTATGVLLGNWALGGFVVLGFFAGMAISRAPSKLLRLILPALFAIMWGFIGPKVFV